MKVRRDGFTLIEVLVTLLILGLLLSLLYGVLVSTLGSKKKMETVGARMKVQSAIVRIIAQDIRGVYTYSVEGDSTPSPGEKPGEKPDEDPSPGEIPRIEGSFLGEDGGDTDSLTFLSSRDQGGSEDALPTSFSTIHYALQPGAEMGLYSLFRGVEPFAPGDEDAPGPAFVRLYDRVILFDLEYLGEEDWVENWKAPRPPRAIRLTLDFRIQGESEEKETTPFQAVFTIPTS